jgi:hypothetical protein
MLLRKYSFFILVLLTYSLPLFAQSADDIRGGWIQDVDGVRHIYILKILGDDITGIYCTDCKKPNNLAFIDDGLLDGNKVSFSVYHDPVVGVPYRDQVEGEFINGELHIRREGSGSNKNSSNMVLHRSPPDPFAFQPPDDAEEGAPPVFPPQLEYVPPGPAEQISFEKVKGLWLWGSGPTKQYFIFRQVDGEIRGMVCGPCDNTNTMSPLDKITFNGTNFHFNIVHEDWLLGPDNKPFNNVTDATLSENEMRMVVVPDSRPESRPLGMTLLGPIGLE